MKECSLTGKDRIRDLARKTLENDIHEAYGFRVNARVLSVLPSRFLFRGSSYGVQALEIVSAFRCPQRG